MLAKAGIEMADTGTQTGGNMEGKETRFGIANSALFATITTDASCGAVNCMHDSFTPLGGLVPLFNIELGEVVFGGVGAGLYGMLMFAILAVFIAGLMVGRTPEYLGKKIEQKEVKMAMIAMLVLAASILFFAGASSVVEFAKNSLLERPRARPPRIPTTPAPTAFRKFSMRSPAPPATTAAPSRASTPTPPGTTSRLASPC